MTSPGTPVLGRAGPRVSVSPGPGERALGQRGRRLRPIDAHRAHRAARSHRCGLQTCRAKLAFTGSAVAFVSTRGPNRGIARLKLDGVTVKLVDLYASTLRPASVVFVTSVTPGRHVLSVTVTATHNAASTGSRVDVDAFEVLIPGG